MSATQLFREAANAALEQIADRLWPGAKLCLVIYTDGEPGRHILFTDQQPKLDEALSTLRRCGLCIDGDNLYKQDLCDCIAGALAFGKQGRNLPPEGHWLRRFWDLGRAEGECQEDLVIELRLAAETLRRYEALHRAKNTEESTAKAELNASLAERFESVIAAATV